MNFLNFFKDIFIKNKKLDLSTLPSQGLFYKDDFEILIKRANTQDISEYKDGYIKDNIAIVINKIKMIVEKNTILPKGYVFDDIKSIDIIFIFLEIVKFTKSKKIVVNYINEEVGKEEQVEFNSEHFNYFRISEEMKKYYDSENKCFELSGFKYTLPSIGVETSLTNFLISKSGKPDSFNYKDYLYDFTHFLSDKKQLSFSEIENLIQVFNYDLEKTEIKKIRNIVLTFSPIQRYSLIKNGKVIDISAKIDLEKIWN